jgi:SPP1 gp7 family putative phage head morphogenesis protein
MADPLRIVLPVPFNEAIRAATAREVVLPNVYYGELQGAARAQAFTIAGMSKIAQLQQALDDMNQGLRSGMTFGEWRNKAAERDWALPDHRLDLIMRMHTQTAYQAGHWEQFDRLSERRGYLMYSAINDSRTRPAHRAMDGIIRSVDDSFWSEHSPPCGYNCRCGLVSLTADQVDARGGATALIPPDARADPGFGSRPEIGPHVLDESIGRAMVDSHGSFQDEIRRWYDEITHEKIIRRVRDYVPDYDAKAEELGPWLEETDGLLAEHEAVALRYYTADGYNPLNAFLRGYTSEDLNVRATVAAAVSGLAKLAPFEGTVYRGAWLENIPNAARFTAAHQVGEIVEYSGFTSASYESGFNGTVQFSIRSLNGRVVEELAADPFEREVIFMPGTRFRVVSVQGTHPTRIVLEELQDQNVAVPPSNKFAQDDAGDKPPARIASDALQARVQAEMNFAEPHVMEKFMAEHDGMTPLQYALATFPSARMEVEQHAPHLLPKKPE